MTSYMYNPSKKVTEILQQYLEFDPEELRVGIWSGNLSLRNVHLREDAIYPLLNQFYNTSGLDKEYQKPPLRFKLVSGTIGEFDMKIPWQRLVWGNGDVRVSLRNVVLVLALETRDETLARFRSRKRQRSTSNSPKEDKDASSAQFHNLLDDALFEFPSDTDDGADDKKPKEDATVFLARRAKKQRRLREAEVRALQGRPMGEWLALLKKKDDAERAKALKKEATGTLEKKTSLLEKWLRGTVSGFYWKFLAGLQMDVENFKIILVQDGVEVGLNIPSISVAPRKQTAQGGNDVTATKPAGGDGTAHSVGESSGAPEDARYDGAEEDGEHVDKKVQFNQVGVYVRQQVISFHNPEPLLAPDLATKEYILRPVDLVFSFSLFFPYPPERRRSRKREPVSRETSMTSLEEASGTCDNSSAMSSKRRRGKREKSTRKTAVDDSSSIQLTKAGTTDQFEEQFKADPSVLSGESPGFSRRLSDAGLHARVKMNLASATPEKGHRLRRSSLYGPMSASAMSKPKLGVPHSTTVSLPLARPQNMEIASVEVKSKARKSDLSSRIEGKMNVGAVQLICSSRHYELLCFFVTGGARLRNGRPNRTIRSVLNQGQALRKSLTITAPATVVGTADPTSTENVTSEVACNETREIRLELHSARTERSEVIEAWWRYMVGAVIWELRQRRRVRRAFQERFLSFSWERQRYKRKTYVRLFIQTHLLKLNGTAEEMLDIEDELAIEQILLYRSLARAVHVRGESEFPESILYLRSNQAGAIETPVPLDDNEVRHASLRRPRQLKRENEGLQGEHENHSSTPGNLGRLELTAERLRFRRDTKDDEDLPSIGAFVPFAQSKARASEYDEISFATTRTAGTMATAMLNPALLETQTSIMFSFSVNVEAMEFLVVEEDTMPGAFTPPPDRRDSSSSQSPMTDVSVLTDDFKYDKSELGGKTDFESLEDLAASPEEFLLFSIPEKILLRAVLSPLDLSVLGVVGQFGNLNFAVQRIELSGEDGRLLSIGELSPTEESSRVESNDRSQSAALSLSLVRTKESEGTSMQCDAATVHLTHDPRTYGKLSKFSACQSFYLPSSVLQRSSREAVRLYVLRQSSQSMLSRVNASIRINGLQIALPCCARDSRSQQQQEGVIPDLESSGAVLKFDMIEMYSGSNVFLLDFAATGPSASGSEAGTRQLQMLQGTDLDKAMSPLSHRWVISTSGIDISVHSGSNSRLSLLQNPVDAEMFLTMNSDSVIDFNRAKMEALVKISPVQFLFSETRLKQLADCAPSIEGSWKTNNGGSCEDFELPPRLEVLSRFILSSIDVQVSRLRVSLISFDSPFQPPSFYTKKNEMEEILIAFLAVVSCFDLGFPHEEALSSAMQICIDRLSSLGFSLEEAWQISNVTLLAFLEDMTESRQGDEKVDSLSKPTDELDILDNDCCATQNIMQKSVSRIVEEYSQQLQQYERDSLLISQDIVLDFTEGFSLAMVKLFYDSHLFIRIPSLFVANGDGLHLLRLTPAADHVAQPPGDPSMSNGMVSGESSSADQSGFQLHCFRLDKESPFGRGGEGLAVLGSDVSLEDDCQTRSREQLCDFELGDVEIFVAKELLTDVIETAIRVSSPLRPLVGTSSADAGTAISPDGHALGVIKSASVLLASEDLTPFCRFGLTAIVAKNGPASQTTADGSVLTAGSLEVFNLSPDSEMYPEIVSLLHKESDHDSFQPGPSPPLRVDYRVNRQGGEIDVALHGIRFIYLHLFISELIQYASSEKWGIGKILSALRSKDHTHTDSRASGMPYKVTIFESSVVVPRSSFSSDMVAIEVKSLTLESSDSSSTFTMPGPSHGLSTDDLVTDFVDCQSVASPLHDETDERDDAPLIPRYHVCLDGIHVFTALAERQDTHNTVENPSFNFFYGFDGRADNNKPVYTARNVMDTEVISEVVMAENASKALRCWRRISSETFNLDVFVDYSPHKRILLTSPIDRPSPNVALDVLMSQFNLLLNVWYGNFQELPRMFPYSTEELKRMAEDPSKNIEFPDIWTDPMKELLMNPHSFSSEMCMNLDSLTVRCSFDCFDESGALLGESPAIVLSFGNAVLHHTYDTLGVGRLGFGCTSAKLVDESRLHDTVISLSPSRQESRAWADLAFGLNESFGILQEGLPQPFQMTLYMVKSWKLYNIGMDASEITMSDLDPIWRFLEFVGSYFSEEIHGNPIFAAMKTAEKLKMTLKQQRSPVESAHDDADKEVEAKTDFRLWLTSPKLIVPCQPHESSPPCLRFSGDGGLWYHYTSIDAITYHECASGGLSLAFCDDIESAIHPGGDADQPIRPILNGLSFGFRMDFNAASNHTDYAVRVPFRDSASCSVTSERISVTPALLSKPTVCTPYFQPHRYLGANICEITCMIELLPSTSSAILGFFADVSEEAKEVPKALDGEVVSDGTFSAVASIGDIRVFALDPVLESHLPVAVISVAGLHITASQFGMESEWLATDHSESSPGDVHVVIDGHLWADYFKLGVTRSWEPLLEAYRFSILWVKSDVRGSGISLSSDSPLHFNISSAFLVTLNQVFDTYSLLIRETFHSGDSGSSPDDPVLKRTKTEPVDSIQDSIEGVCLLHKMPRGDLTGRVAFSLKNLTGQELRIFHIESSGHPMDSVTYLEHHRIAQLSFQPSVSMIENLAVKEVAYPGLNQASAEVESHEVDIQLPGCRWLRGLKIDTFGRSFASIVPRSLPLRSKSDNDWRLGNLLKVLIEVGLENGGRQVTVRSLFSVVNKTCHDVMLLCHPDASYSSKEPDTALLEKEGDSEIASFASDSLNGYCIGPGQSYHLPVLLLLDSLNRNPDHAGSIWIKPGISVQNPGVMNSFLKASSPNLSDNARVCFSSKAVHLTRVVTESASIFESARSADVPPAAGKSGVQVSCPVIQNSGDRLAPFCYVVEVGRSPLVKAAGTDDGASGKKSKFTHGPVSYTLSIYPPLIIANRLPKRGRFELMHAVRRTILWFADLDAGEEVSVHTVGLDAPLLLLINLGFCRTPVGEGALVHHGVDHRGIRENLGGLKSIGKAGKAVTRQLGKTLTAIGESPDKRGQHRLNMAQNPQLLATRSARQGRKRKRHNDLRDAHIDPDLETPVVGDSKTYRIDPSVFSPLDVSDETTLVDGVGQKITLNVENIRGGGGQRKISIFCPYWIVNTTEHALRYKQENSKTFVSGTVISPDKNGSLVQTSLQDVGLRTDTDSQNLSRKGVFSGTPGALASEAGHCALPPEKVAELVDSSLSLEKLADSAFMFNFHEELSLGIGNQRLCMQLGDGTGATPYQSDWSKGLSLDSVGISQVISMHCKDGRFLELTVLVYVAPGALASHTKIVRLLPRYVIVNALPHPVRLWQDSSVFRPIAAEQVTGMRGETKWRYKKGTSRQLRRNQYEALWGREATLDAGYSGKMTSTTTANQSALYISTIGRSQLLPFALPDSRGQRQLRIGLGSPWNLTASFSADVAGDHVLALTKSVDLKLLPHVSTRASPEYLVTLYPGMQNFNGELGVWYETEWGGNRRIIVKAVKKTSYAFNQTDIHIGDELLKIDGVSVSKKTFPEVMSLLRDRLNEISSISQETKLSMRRATMRLVGRQQTSASGNRREPNPGTRPLMLRFRTVEERLRRVRLKAAKENAASDYHKTSPLVNGENRQNDNDLSEHSTAENSAKFIKAEIKTLHHMMFLVLKEDCNPPFQIQNQTFSSTIYYRQKGCNGHSWHSLNPGKTSPYAWQEPLKLKRLSIRVASESTFLFAGSADDDGHKLDPKEHRRGPRKVAGEEDALFSATVNVRLEEIGFRDFLPWQPMGQDSSSPYKWVELEVDVVGATRVLVVRDLSKGGNNQVQLEAHLNTLRHGIEAERLRLRALNSLNDSLVAHADEDYGYEPAESVDESRDESAQESAQTAKDLMSDFSGGPSIKSRHQLLVEVIEATGLNPDAFVGECNPYAEVRLKSGDTRRSFFRKMDVRRTYFVKKSVQPTWEMQSFVFNVPPEAVDVPRGHAVSIRLLNRRAFGYDQLLGKAQVDLHTLRNQEPLLGWFPLAGRTGRRELENQLSHWGRGSVKLRLQWIYSIPALLQYFILISEVRCLALETSLEGLVEQAQERQDAEEKKRNESDGFKPVRIQDFLSISKKKPVPGGLSKEPKILRNRDNIESIKRPQRSSTRTTVSPTERQSRTQRDRVRRLTPDSGNGFDRMQPFCAEKALSPRGIFKDLEHCISQQRQNFHTLSRPLEERKTQSSSSGELATQFYGSALKSATLAQVLFSDTELETELENEKVHARLRRRAPVPKQKVRPEQESSVAEKFRLPLNVPASLLDFSETQMSSFLRSRDSFQRASTRSLSAVLHHGGWLTIRPIRALNLPDSFNGMSVKLRYGSQVLSTGTADARVSPWWSAPTGIKDGSFRRSVVEAAKLESFYDQPNDMHIHVTPQKTNGLMRLSVYGEKSQQQLQSKTEIGIIYLPLGNAIAACVDAETTLSIGIYERWFPLISPREAVPTEGDGGLSFRPTESEQLDERGFGNLYKPCIQLALIWHPDEEVPNSEDDHEEETDGSVRDSSTFTGSKGVKSYINADIARISMALIDSERAVELLSFNILDLDMRYWITNAKTRFGVSLYWMQIDYQDKKSREPVVLAPTPTDFLFPVLQAFAVKDNIRSSEVVSFDFIDISVAEFDLTIEESLLSDLYSLFNSISLQRGMDRLKTVQEEAGAEGDDPSLLCLLEAGFSGDSKERKKVYIEQLFLGVVRVNLSYVKGKRAAWDLAPKNVGWIDIGIEEIIKPFSAFHEPSDAFAAWSRQTSDDDRLAEGKGFQNLPKLFTTLFPNLSDAPVRLQGKALNHVFESPTEIFHSIRKFYVNETLKQIYKIIGSLDFVGNPTMLVSSLFSGVRDLVVAPSTAFMNSPTDPSRVGMGVAKGTLSLLSHSTSGFFSFWSKIAATAGQTVAALSLDSDYSNWHREKVLIEATNLNRHWKKRGVQNVGAMIMRPVSDLIIGVAGGVFGLVISPVKGYRRSGGPGLVRGIAVGGIGVVTRPVVGVLDAFAHFTGSIHDIAKSVNILERRLQPALKIRLPYNFGVMGILMPFDADKARADYLLKRFPVKKSRKAALLIPETLLHVEVLPNNGIDTFTIVTTARVVLIRVKKENSGELSPSLCWEFYFATDTAVSSTVLDHGHSGVALRITLTKSSSSSGKDSRDKTLPKISAMHECILSPGLISSADSSQVEDSEDLGSGLSIVETGEEFDHQTGRGSEGEQLEWFTILAEYQYRRQLGRLHNAICCLAGDFGAILYDPALGYHAGQRLEGYTTFGIYHFSRTEVMAKTMGKSRETGISDHLEKLPWVNESDFRLVSSLPPLEQEEALASSRRDWSISKLIDLLKDKGSPEWFVAAHARALLSENEGSDADIAHESIETLDHVDLFDPTGAALASAHVSPEAVDSQRGLRSPLVGWRSNSISYTSPFGTQDYSESTELTNTARVDDSKVLRAVPSDVEGSQHSGTEGSPADKLGQLKSFSNPPGDEGSLKSPFMSPRMTLNRKDELMQSFVTAAGMSAGDFSTPLAHKIEGNEKKEPELIRQLSSGRSEEDVFASARQRSSSGFSSTSGGLQRIESWIRSSDSTDEKRQNDATPRIPSQLNGQTSRKEQQELPPSNDRLDRVEALMERLVVFSTEQAMVREQVSASAPGLTTDELSKLRQEISDLRSALQNRNNDNSNAAEIAALREELAWMRGQLHLSMQQQQHSPTFGPPLAAPVSTGPQPAPAAETLPTDETVAAAAFVPFRTPTNRVTVPPLPPRPSSQTALSMHPPLLTTTTLRQLVPGSTSGTGNEQHVQQQQPQPQQTQESVPAVVESPETPPSEESETVAVRGRDSPLVVSWLSRSSNQLVPQDLDSIQEVD